MSATNSQRTNHFDPSFELRISPTRKSLDAELCRVGKIKKHLQPPGGSETSLFVDSRSPTEDANTPTRKFKKLVKPPGDHQGIFDAFRLPPEDKRMQMKKCSNTYKSSVFGPVEDLPPRPLTPLKLTTHYKLFQKSPPKFKVRKESNTMKSSALDIEEPIMVPRFYVKKDPITGQGLQCPKIRQKSAKKRNPITFEGILEKRFQCKRMMLPPGGISTISLEYIE